MPDFTHETGEVAIRFHRESEWFVASRAAELYVLRVQANSERAAELFHRLSAHLDPLVDIEIEDEREGHHWHGALRSRDDVREAIGRLRWPLASDGGVEISLVTADDQLTLMRSLELVICSRRDHWRTRLAAEGIAARASAPAAQWRSERTVWSAAPELAAALSALVDRLALERGP
ncbi:MAG: hypothetical protein ABMA00_14400 [Gemmatimonas sp.]